ncbi:MAG: prephenate dehydratase [Desulforhabdus sp.]|jgi:chorismate mutase/prephenate dehydratase|nr:prephenate dehydratase [Desulforhabdus sp.]
MGMEDDLKQLRGAIDQVDLDLLKLFNRRMELAQQVGRVKASNGLELFVPGREELIIQRLLEANSGPLNEASLRAIYREIFAASRLLQYVLQVSYLGPEWTYSHLAALSLFGHSAHYIPYATLEDVFDALLKSRVHVAVVPVENSLQGGVGRTMDLLYEKDVRVVGECYIEIANCLCSHLDAIPDVKHLYAHPLAMEQCRRWVYENLHDVEWYECTSTAQAAQLAQKDPAGGAICNLYAAHHYGLRILAERIEDHAGNTTRFFALASHFNPSTGNDKTSVLFAMSDEPGALYSALEAFARSGVNMTRIESRPNRLFPWQYLFYADIEGHHENEKVRAALQTLRSRVTFLKILGSYVKNDPTRPIRLEKEKIREAPVAGV